MTETPQDTPQDTPETDSGSGSYAAYDNRRLGYYGGVHSTRAKAKAAAKTHKIDADDLRIDQV